MPRALGFGGRLTKSEVMIWSMGPLWVMRAWWSMPEKPIMARRPFLTSAVYGKRRRDVDRREERGDGVG
jgi:hypothetical protein